MGLSPVLIAFVATVIGGMGSLPGAVLGGFLLGSADGGPAGRAAGRAEALPGRVPVHGGDRSPALPAQGSGRHRRGEDTGVSWTVVTAVTRRAWPVLALVVPLALATLAVDLWGSAILERTTVTMLVNLILVVGLYIFVGQLRHPLVRPHQLHGAGRVRDRAREHPRRHEGAHAAQPAGRARERGAWRRFRPGSSPSP